MAEEADVAPFHEEWNNYDWSADFTDPHAPWRASDIHELRDCDISHGAALADFVRYVHRGIARVTQGGGGTPYIVRERANGAPVYRRATVRDINNIAIDMRFTIGSRRNLKFATALSMMHGLVPHYRMVDNVPYMRAADRTAVLNLAPGTRGLNLFSGFPHADAPLLDDRAALAAPFFSHIQHAWCGDDARLYEYVVSWFAELIQRPTHRPATTLVVTGPQGAGKSNIAHYFGTAVLGRDKFLQVGMEHVVCEFNSLLSNRILVLVDGLPRGVRRVRDAALMRMATAPLVPIKWKYVPVRDETNKLHFIYTGNNEPFVMNPNWHVALRVANVPPRAYFNAMHAAFARPDTARAIYQILAERDLTRYDAMHIPRAIGA